jgi:hypothetical protein
LVAQTDYWVSGLKFRPANKGNQDMEQLLQLVIVFFAGLATGGLMVNWIGLGRAMSHLSASTYAEFRQATNRTFDPYMPIVVMGAVLGGIVLAIFCARDSFALRRIGHCWICLLCCIDSDWLAHMCTNQHTDRTLVRSEPAQ